MDLKEALLFLVDATHAKETTDLLPHCDDTQPEPGHWTAKDNLAHLAAWRVHAAEVLDAARTGHEHADDGKTLEQTNAGIHEATKDLALARVLADSDRSWAKLRKAIHACSTADLEKPRPGNPGQQAWEVVPGNTHFHLAEHLGYWNSEHGNEAAAEAAAVWAHDINNEAFSGAKQRAYSAYNLGCYFARRGNLARALPYLRDGIELMPDLKDWAKQDVDLDPIRASPEVMALLA
jgi:hypothetical protein